MIDWESLQKSLTELLAQYGLRTIGALVLLIVGWILSSLIGRLTGRSLQSANVDETLSIFLLKFARWTILILAILASLSIFGIQTTSFAAVIGAAGLAIGLAFQGTLSSFSAGGMLLLFRPFKVGDYVRAGGESGTVSEIGLFSTTLDTPDNKRIIIPNSEVFGSVIENVTYHETRRVDISVGVDYAADIDQTRQVLMECAKETPGRLTEKDPVVALVGLGGSSVDWAVRIWCKTEDYWDVRDSGIRAVKMALDQAGIGIPFPQMDVHLDQPVGNG